MSDRVIVRARSWCFTINNYNDVDQQRLRSLGGDAGLTYLIFGRERGTTGTPHLQGYIQFRNAKVFAVVKRIVGERAHLEKSFASPDSAATYCKKEGDYEEFGTAPVGSGKRTDLIEFIDWLQSLENRPSLREIIIAFPALYNRSGTRLWDFVDAHVPRTALVPVENVVLREWQQDLVSDLGDGVDDRTISFYVDPVGNTGKSFICRYLMTVRDDVQCLRIGKRDDLAHAIDQTKKVFLIDVPRSQMQFLQYSILEMLKDRTVFSPKYHSGMKVLSTTPFVIVFCNENPDMEALSEDRYDIKQI
jgi:Putative viral replication protein